MEITSTSTLTTVGSGAEDSGSSILLNAYRIVNQDELRWPIATYNCVPLSGAQPKSENRGQLKDLIWQLRSHHKGWFSGYGFVLDVDEVSVAVPSSWNIPAQMDFKEYRISHGRTYEAQASIAAHRLIVAGILRESIKRHFKDSYSDKIGPMWQDFGDFCQMPSDKYGDSTVLYCRKFHVVADVIQDCQWVIKIEVSTKSLDARTLDDYYRSGDVQQLADMIGAKRGDRLTRKNEPVAIRVWCGNEVGADVLELDRPEEILAHARLSAAEQQNLVNATIRCKRFGGPSLEVPIRKLRLVFDTQLALEDHDETIISPDDRAEWHGVLRDLFDGMEAYGRKVHLADMPVTTDQLPCLVIMPPALRLRTSSTRIGIMPAPESPTAQALSQRAKLRASKVRKYGYLEHRPINPLLAWPERFEEKRAQRMQRDLNSLLEAQGLSFRFGPPYLFRSVHDLIRAIDRGKHDALLAVLPESRRDGQSDNDTHEQIKKRVEVPSQCIHYDNTLPPQWIGKRVEDFQKTQPQLARRIENHYHLSILNLLVKHHWVPFAPAEPFDYNVHIGIDVGGRHNNRVMACAGYGFSNPSQGLIFLPWQIDIDIQQPEPIPTNYLFEGLRALLEELHDQVTQSGLKPDFDRVLFCRDGELRGHGEAWNEIDAFGTLHRELHQRQWITDNSLWTAVEVSKRASYWRVLQRINGTIYNPLVGQCVFPFEGDSAALVCTTGRPYLSQGTTAPLLVHIHDLFGRADREQVLRDIVWEADMCYSKLDMGRRLPWVLHVANSGALQLSRAYKVSGVTI